MSADPAVVAEQIRTAREGLVRDIREGRVDLVDADGAEDIDLVKIVVLVEAVPGVGKVKARHILDTLGVDHGTRWGELGPRRSAVLDALSQARSGGASPTSAP